MTLGEKSLVVVLSGMRRIASIIIQIITIGLLFLPVKAYAQVVVIESGDQFLLISPINYSTLFDNAQISFRAYDNDQAEIPYEAKLLDSSCRNDYGVIATGKAPSLSDKFTTIDWNTHGPLVNRSTVENGNYCMQVCANLMVGQQANVVCSTRNIQINNTNNHSPVFTNVPIGEIKVKSSDSWQFQLRASDPERDKLTFSIFAAPDFVGVDQNSGLLTVTAGNKQPGKYEVILNVSDGKSLPAEQRFFVNVVPQNVFVSEQGGDDKATEILIMNPQPGTIFAGKNNNVVKWVINDGDGISEIKLQYSIDGRLWKQLIALNGLGNSVNDSNYQWDVSALPTGNYYLKFIVTDKLGRTTEKISDPFIIGSINELPNTSVPLIINISPEDTSEINNRRPAISGNFIPSYRYTINTSTFKFFLDGKDVSNLCTVTSLGFDCKLTDDLALGRHLLKVQVNDSSNKTALREWVFTIVTDQPSSTSVTTTQSAAPQAQVNIDVPRITILIILGICLLALVLIVLPWILYLLWRRRKNNVPDTIIAAPRDNAVTIKVDYPQNTYPQPVVMTPLAPPVPQQQPTVNLVPPPPIPEKKEDTKTATVPDWLKERKVETTDKPQFTGFGYGTKAED